MNAIIINSVWVLMAAILVFIMHAGFALVEVGFTRAKNAVNIAMKNFMTISLGVLCYYFVGFGIMYGDDLFGGFMGWGQFMLMGSPATVCDGTLNFDVYFFFQAIFCATCATIVSGAAAERTKFSSYIFFCIFASCVVYPIVGHWVWSGNGWLSELGFHDFAGGTVVHALGGISALVTAKLVGPRKGKYRHGRATAIPGHNLIYGTLGVLLLFFGWFGFNAGSTLDVYSSEGLSTTMKAAEVTFIAAAASTVAAMIFTKLRYKKADAGLILNGALAGLVGITPGADCIAPYFAIIVGAVCSIVMVLLVEFIDNVLKIDDPVGAIAVHGGCGTLGTLFVGIFGDGGLVYGHIMPFLKQILGVSACLAFGAVLVFLFFFILKHTTGIRVTEDEEVEGLALAEHGISAYSQD
ncbi:MAG: ammonium transporter [Acutalibacteraceae bacterium]